MVPWFEGAKPIWSSTIVRCRARSGSAQRGTMPPWLWPMIEIRRSGPGVHRPDRVDDVLAGDLDVVHRVARQLDRAPGDPELVERRLPVPGEVGVRVDPRSPGTSSTGSTEVAAGSPVALQARVELPCGTPSARPRLVTGRVADRAGGSGQTAGRPRSQRSCEPCASSAACALLLLAVPLARLRPWPAVARACFSSSCRPGRVRAGDAAPPAARFLRAPGAGAPGNRR